MFAITACLIIIISVTFWVLNRRTSPVPISVNYFLHRKCNYQCKFCFHTAKTADILPLEKAKEGLTLLKKAGMRKLNFSGGEPFFKAGYLGKLVEFSK